MSVCRLILLSVIIVFGLMVFMIALEWDKNKKLNAVGFFAAELQKQGVSETVFIDDVMYRVTNGDVLDKNGLRVANNNAYGPLRLAYAVTIARRAPLYTIAGTDTGVLRSEITKLERAQEMLSRQQADGTAARVVTALFPIRYLFALAAAEERRGIFLTESSEENYAEYEESLRNVRDTAYNDLRRFTEAFNAVTGTTSTRMLSLIEVTSPMEMRNVLKNFRDGLKKTAQLLDERITCMRGNVSKCGPIPTLELPIPRKLSDFDSRRTRNSEISRLWTEAGSHSVSQKVVLDESVCLRNLLPPYNVHVGFTDVRGYLTYFLRYDDELFFMETDQPNARTLWYLRNTLGISFIPGNPLMFYQCPRVGEDIGLVTTIISVAEFAKQHPELAPEARSGLLLDQGGFSQQKAFMYLDKAFKASLFLDVDSATRYRLEELALMSSRRTGGLEYLVRQVARVTSIDVVLSERGVPMDLSARTWFLTHSAFPSFFRIAMQHNTLSDNDPASENICYFNRSLVRYSDIRDEIPREKIIHDLKAFLNFENPTPMLTPIPSAMSTSR